MLHDIKLVVNGRERELRTASNRLLLDALRDDLSLTGTKRGCDEGVCGACTVLLDGEPVNACLTLAVEVDARTITTIEGLAHGEELDPLQTAFIEHGAVQCGFCTAGMLLTTSAYLRDHPSPSEEDIRHAIEGNLCRCTGYAKIIQAISSVAGRASDGSRQGARA